MDGQERGSGVEKGESVGAATGNDNRARSAGSRFSQLKDMDGMELETDETEGEDEAEEVNVPTVEPTLTNWMGKSVKGMSSASCVMIRWWLKLLTLACWMGRSKWEAEA